MGKENIVCTSIKTVIVIVVVLVIDFNFFFVIFVFHFAFLILAAFWFWVTSSEFLQRNLASRDCRKAEYMYMYNKYKLKRNDIYTYLCIYHTILFYLDFKVFLCCLNYA